MERRRAAYRRRFGVYGFTWECRADAINTRSTLGLFLAMHRIKAGMRRPTLIVAEPEPEQALSTRKLVLETAKFNVLTAHSTDEALDVFQLFPNAACVIAVDAATVDCDRILKFVHTIRDDIPLIALSPREAFRCAPASHHLSSHEPEALVQLMRKLLGDPRQIDASTDLRKQA